MHSLRTFPFKFKEIFIEKDVWASSGDRGALFAGWTLLQGADLLLQKPTVLLGASQRFICEQSVHGARGVVSFAPECVSLSVCQCVRGCFRSDTV